METCTALTCALHEDYLKTPSTESEWKAIARDFANKWEFPHCLGAIDGKHIFIQPPPKSGSMYFNYKSSFSIILMAVVDANYKFVYASIGTQGRVSDVGVFAHSDLKEAMDTGTLNFPPADTLPGTDAMMPHMLIGDDAYPLRPDLMKPYPFRNLNTNQRIYNYRLSRAVLWRTLSEFWQIASEFSEQQFDWTQTSLSPLSLRVFVCTAISNETTRCPL
ncbi:unnamed protein product [Oreochromis niloticus]|nr:unnamed protein product [Mustela putorius furo]